MKVYQYLILIILLFFIIGGLTFNTRALKTIYKDQVQEIQAKDEFIKDCLDTVGKVEKLYEK